MGLFVQARKWWIVAFSAVALVLGIAGLIDGGRLTAATIVGLEADEATRLVDEVTGRPEATSLAVVIRAAKGSGAPRSMHDTSFIAARDEVLARGDKAC
ncbi:hypothetical protein EON77_11950, partial [bacterium]